MTNYTNMPVVPSTTNATVQAFDAYYSKPLELDVSVYTSVKSFFTSKGFENNAADNIAVLIIKESKINGLNPMKVIDSLKGLDSVEISSLVNEIINFNRFKTSFLGSALAFSSNPNIVRNVIA